MRPETATRVGEDHFFFEPPTLRQALYARMHVPEEPLDLGVVVVPPIGRERVRFIPEMAGLGRDLAAAGFPVLRFDFRGEGESTGEFRHSTVTSRVADTIAAAAELRRRSHVGRVALIGFHLGAVIAGLAARDAKADLLMLCDPVWDLHSYVKNLFRANIFQQSQYFGRATASEPDLRAALRAGNAVSFYSFPTAAPLVDELESVDVAATLREFPGESVILYFASTKALPARSLTEWGGHLGVPARCTVSPVMMNFSWTTRKQWTPRLKPLNEAIVQWLGARIHADQSVDSRRS